MQLSIARASRVNHLGEGNVRCCWSSDTLKSFSSSSSSSWARQQWYILCDDWSGPILGIVVSLRKCQFFFIAVKQNSPVHVLWIHCSLLQFYSLFDLFALMQYKVPKWRCTFCSGHLFKHTRDAMHCKRTTLQCILRRGHFWWPLAAQHINLLTSTGKNLSCALNRFALEVENYLQCSALHTLTLTITLTLTHQYAYWAFKMR